MNEEDKLRQQADAKRREADQLESEKLTLVNKHQANIDDYDRQAQAMRDKADLERDLLAKDEANYNDRINNLTDEASRYDDEATEAAQRAEDRRQAAIIAAAATAAAAEK